MHQELINLRKMSKARRQTLVARLIVGISLLGILGGVFYLLGKPFESKETEIPVLETTDKDVPIKVKPDASENPSVPHKDKLIYQEFSATPSSAKISEEQGSGAVENILELPEEPQTIAPEPEPMPVPEDSSMIQGQEPMLDPQFQEEDTATRGLEFSHIPQQAQGIDTADELPVVMEPQGTNESKKKKSKGPTEVMQGMKNESKEDLKNKDQNSPDPSLGVQVTLTKPTRKKGEVNKSKFQTMPSKTQSPLEKPTPTQSLGTYY